MPYCRKIVCIVLCSGFRGSIYLLNRGRDVLVACEFSAEPIVNRSHVLSGGLFVYRLGWTAGRCVRVRSIWIFADQYDSLVAIFRLAMVVSEDYKKFIMGWRKYRIDHE